MIPVEWPIPAAPGVATTFFPTAVAMSIARPTAVGNRRRAVAGPAVSHRLQASSGRIVLASVAQVGHKVTSGQGVPAVVEADVPEEDENRSLEIYQWDKKNEENFCFIYYGYKYYV